MDLKERMEHEVKCWIFDKYVKWKVKYSEALCYKPEGLRFDSL
jgi:hypothetical protein